MSLAHNSISQYETGKTELTAEVVARFSECLEVPASEIEVYDDKGELREVGLRYHGSELIPADVLTIETLEGILSSLSARVPRTTGPERMKMMEAMMAIGREVDRRQRDEERRKENPAYKPISSISASEAEASVAAAERAVELGAEKGSRRESEAGGTSGHRHGPSEGTSKGTSYKPLPPKRAPK